MLSVLMLSMLPHLINDAATQPEPPAVEAHSTPWNDGDPGDWTVQRVGGDTDAMVEHREGSYFFDDRMSITTPLPEGYPAPTPPGAIELKRYPTVRRAEVTGQSPADIGMNIGFFPLFRHIQRRNIAMTSPVEMDYHADTDQATPPRWTMSFLYRTADLGETGRDGTVAVVDAPAVTVLSIGFRGAYSRTRMEHALRELESWLETHPEWEVTGSPRALYYNGPEKRNPDKWGEAQLPVRLRSEAHPPAKS